MNIKKILTDFKRNKVSLMKTENTLKKLPYENLGYAKLDHHRAARKGFPEVVFCQGKTIEQIRNIVAKLREHNNLVLATRASREVFNALKNGYKEIFYSEPAKMIVLGRFPKKSKKKILVIAAGTSDIPVAEEAAVTAEALGNTVERIYDVGVAGIHRLLSNRKQIEKANVLVVVAGMEGALPSIVSGLVKKPIIAVPTSVGYGSSFRGLSALLAMLNSCSPGVLVVNIDNGFGAGYAAGMMNKLK
ncbi:MAG TPA: nickel pincer cofactor biosynthesis protein LarB [Candidatus Nanoarchaeia archaeon]|nr:nickel pincer cofactor biosynthesis protein LarB [Candidatus Nanoarchaeia archaeon]